jgi:hypothetical protein
MEWENWVEFVEGFLENIDLSTLSQVNQRYKYGELRLSRLNKIYRLLPSAYSIKTFVRGYRSGSTWYSAFFERHFKWMIAVFAIFSVFLSALQVKALRKYCKSHPRSLSKKIKISHGSRFAQVSTLPFLRANGRAQRIQTTPPHRTKGLETAPSLSTTYGGCIRLLIQPPQNQA